MNSAHNTWTLHLRPDNLLFGRSLYPLGAMCVLPLYPGYLAFLAGRTKSGASSTLFLGLAVTGGVLLAMFSFGLVFIESSRSPRGTLLKCLDLWCMGSLHS
jgi:hypothetical protein